MNLQFNSLHKCLKGKLTLLLFRQPAFMSYCGAYLGYLRFSVCMHACQVEKVEKATENIGNFYRPHTILLIPVDSTRYVKA